MQKILFFLPVILLTFPAESQTDTIVVYDLNTLNTSTILPVAFNATVTSDHSSSSVGSLGNVFALPQSPPTSHLFNGSNFSELALATNFFNLKYYPIRTAVSLREYSDTNRYVCSGMIVGPCFVLTSGNCVYDFATHYFRNFDSLRIIPAFNKGVAQPGLPSSLVKKIYLFKSFLNQSEWDDIALLELKEPIGLQTGWTGIGFDSAPNYTTGKVYHKFSYPSQVNPFDSTKVYNGDTLYYNYGYITEQSNWLSVQGAAAIPGQGGSTFLYTDNTDYYSVGLCSFSANYLHYEITNRAFYQLSHILNTQICNNIYTSIKEATESGNELSLFPNPMNTEATLQFEYDPAKHYTLKIVNLLGQQIGSNIEVNSGHVRIPGENLSSGMYLLEMFIDENSRYTCKMAVE